MWDIVSTIPPFPTSMRVATTLSCLYEVWWSVYGSLFSLIITPSNHCINLRKYGVLHILILLYSSDWFTHRTTGNLEWMSFSFFVFVGLVLGWRMYPEMCKFQKVHGFNPINWITDSWSWKCRDNYVSLIYDLTRS